VIGTFIGFSQSKTTILGVPIMGILGVVSATTVLFWVGVYGALRPRLKKVSLLRWLRR